MQAASKTYRQSKRRSVRHDAGDALGKIFGTKSWSDVIAKQTDERARDLHVLRWGLVYNMLDIYQRSNVSHKLSITHRSKAPPSSFEEAVCQKIKPIAKVTCYEKSNNKVWILDMSFGSIEKLSDLDMSMKLHNALDFASMSKALQESRNKHVPGRSLSYTLDMQLYADICTDDLVPMFLQNPEAYMCTSEDVGALVSLMTRIAVAYLKNETLDLHAWAAKEKWPHLRGMRAYPNPKSIQKASQEDALLANITLALEAFQKKKTFQWYILLNAMKTEALVHPVSLAAAGVYSGDVLGAIDRTNILLGMYEFVLNLLIHHKRKYVMRMINVYKSADSACKNVTPLLKKITDGIDRSFSDADDVRLAGSVATYILNDFHDGDKCAQSLPFADMRSLFKKLLDRLVTDPHRRKAILKLLAPW